MTGETIEMKTFEEDAERAGPSGPGPRTLRRVGKCYHMWLQFDALLKKNLKVLFRNSRATCIAVTIPFFFMFMMFALEAIIVSGPANENSFYNRISSDDAVEIDGIPDCIVGQGRSYCYTFAWLCTEGTAGLCSTHASTIVSNIMTKNGDYPNGATISSTKVKEWSTQAELIADLEANPNTTQAAFEFHFESSTDVRFAIRRNQTEHFDSFTRIFPFEYVVPPMVAAAERELLREFGGYSTAQKAAMTYKMRWAGFPRREILKTNIVGEVGTLLFFASAVFSFTALLTLIATEKEKKLRQAMGTMGLEPICFWITWAIVGAIMNTCTILVLCLSGMIFQFDFFLVNDFGTYFWLLLLFSFGIIPTVFLVSSFINSARAAIPAGFLYFIMGFVFQLFIGLLYTDLIVGTDPDIWGCLWDVLTGCDECTGSVCIMNFFRLLFSFFPPVIFGKGLYDLGQASDEAGDSGIRWTDIHDNAEVFPLLQIYGWMVAFTIICSFVAYYFDGIYALHKPWYYPLVPSCIYRNMRGNRNLLGARKTGGGPAVDLTESQSSQKSGFFRSFAWPVMPSKAALWKALVFNVIGPITIPVAFPPFCGTAAAMYFSREPHPDENGFVPKSLRTSTLKVAKILFVINYVSYIVDFGVVRTVLWVAGIVVGLLAVYDGRRAPFRNPDLNIVHRSKLLLNSPLLPADVLVYPCAALFCFIGPLFLFPFGGLVLIARSCTDKHPDFLDTKKYWFWLPLVINLGHLVCPPLIVVTGPLSYYVGVVLLYESFRSPVMGQIINSTGEPSSVDDDVVEEKERLQNLGADQIPDKHDPDAPALRLLRLRKVFDTWSLLRFPFLPACLCCIPRRKRFAAVRNVSMDVRKGELMCLLGPNGAGKSTTFNMLVGNLVPSSGRAIVYGHDVVTEIKEIQKFIGLCPQFDMLYDEISGREHLRLYGALKGLHPEDTERELETLLGKVSLTGSGDSWSMSYSGGMKRRLSVCVALLGEPRLIFLDEPTTGMDPVSRKEVWDLIEESKVGRSVVLTSHSMEEADTLGDRIAIVARGRLKVFGTSLRLKQKYGAGYNVTLILDEASVPAAEDLVKARVASCVAERIAPNVLGFSIARDESSKIPDLFRDIEENQDKLNITDVQLSLATLEEVFLRIAEAAEREEDDAGDVLGAIGGVNEATGSHLSAVHDSSLVRNAAPRKSIDIQVSYRNSQELKSGSRNVFDAQVEATRHEAESVSREGLRKRSSAGVWGTPPPKRPEKYDEVEVELEHGEDENNGEAATSRKKKNICSPCAIHARQTYALFLKNASYQFKQFKTNVCQVLTPILLILLLVAIQTLVNQLTADGIESVDTTEVTAETFAITLEMASPSTSTLLYSIPTGASFTVYGGSGTFSSTNMFPTQSNMQICSIQTPTFWFSENAEGSFQTSQSTLTSSSNIFTFTKYDDKSAIDSLIYNNNVLLSPGEGTEYVAGWVIDTLDTTTPSFDITFMTNYTLTRKDDLPIHIAWATNSIANDANSVEISLLGSYDYPATDEVPFDIVSLLGNFFYILLLHQTLPVIVSLLVYEKENKLREVMKMMGLKTSVYMVVNYVFGFVLYSGVVLTLIFGCLFFDVIDVVYFPIFSLNVFPTYVVLFVLWGLCLCSLSFLFSVFFASARTATVVSYFYVIGMGVLASNWISSLRGLESTNIYVVVTSLQPSLTLMRGLDELSSKTENQGPGISWSDYFSTNHNLWEIYAYLFFEAVIFIVLAAYLDAVSGAGFGVRKHPLFFLSPAFWNCGRETKVVHAKPHEPRDVPSEPDDVKAARMALAEGTAEDFAIRVVNLRKEYPARGGAPPYLAVKDFTVGIRPGECLGLLGPNGAGKTTAISILSGLFKPTSGNAFFDNLSIKSDIDQIHTMCGVCPQHDVLWEPLSAAEHLRFYGRLHGLYGRTLDKAVTKSLKDVNLYKQRNKPCGTYSGGQKRRLSVAISLIGSPKFVFLDEPSTGLDPASRRNLWDVILAAKTKTSILITTHSMEEADVLCDRISIFVKGSLRAIGHSTDLKARFGSGFKLTVAVPPGQNRVLRMKAFVEDSIPGAVLFNELAGVMNFHLPRDNVRVSDVFATMEANRTKYNVLDWGITNSTLEEVFLKICEEGGQGVSN